MRPRLSYANVAATMALVFAMSGGALAARHYLISSTKQINPKVLKQLRGTRGTKGAQGAVGPQGATGPTGPAGKEGKPGKEGPSAADSLSTSFVQMTFSRPKLLVGGVVLVLATKTSGGGKNLVITGTSARVMVQATIQAISGIEGTSFGCHFAAQGLAGGEPVSFGLPSKSTIPAGERYAALPMTANIALVGPETYDLQIYCETISTGQPSVIGGSLNAVAYQ